MIGNRYLQALYEYGDRDTSINQLLEFLKYMDKEFIESIHKEVPNINILDESELEFLTIAVSLMDYYFQFNKIEVPEWLRDKKLAFKKPYYYSKRLSDFEKVRLLFSNPSPFRLRNVYFDLNSLVRI
jgi:hypothetical protein